MPLCDKKAENAAGRCGIGRFRRAIEKLSYVDVGVALDEIDRGEPS
jgi:hypothetical protein